MNIAYESADNFIKITNKKYRFIVSHKRKTQEIILDFYPSDYRHATGLHHVTDIVIERNPTKLLDAILKEPYTVTDEILDKSNFIRVYQIQPFGSIIGADYFIESFFRKNIPFKGTSIYWMLKEKITDKGVLELFRHPNYIL